MAPVIAHAPPPWTCKATVYNVYFWTSKHVAANFPAKAYSPLEGQSDFASAEFGKPIGGLTSLQLIRYTETPVGPYDELLLVPGKFLYPVESKDGKREVKKGLKLTRIYVSTKETCWNGRKNWNIPKHLAKFDWEDHPDGSVSVKVFPHDTADVYDAAEARPSDVPLFKGTFKPMRYLPSFPMSTRLYEAVGVDLGLIAPPLPTGAGSQGELVGTNRWCRSLPYQYSPNSSLLWVDMNQKDENGKAPDEFENFWPGIGRWTLGVVMKDAVVKFADGEHWDTPKSLL
ncbi:hypothetical protein GQ53DRAFT_511554 [Thozetella sp. PMI_491]|nr:hypothetical protein GQ53DRAFT_511554 [Thozetella sp. PMI_491]